MRQIRFWRLLVAILIGSAAFGSTLLATTLVRMDLATLAHSAELIVRARCINSQTLWDSASIWTFDEFQVIETFKGAPPQTIRVRLPGGRAGHLETKVDGVPHFSAGEEVVLFVERNSAGDFGVTSWAQGTFRVRRDAANGAEVTQDTSHIETLDPQTHQFAPTGIRNITLEEFRVSLSAALSAPLPAKQGKVR